jgi:hypothetical protein
MLSLITREGLAGMEVVEVSPPYDVGDITSVLGVRVINDVLGTLVQAGKLGRRSGDVEDSSSRTADETGDNAHVGG